MKHRSSITMRSSTSNRNDVRRNSEKATSDKAIIAQAKLNRCEQALDNFAEIIKTVVEQERSTIVQTMSDNFYKGHK